MRIHDEKNETILKNRTIKDQEVTIEECTECKIVDCDFSFDGNDETMLTLKNCVGCVVSECEFHDKRKKGLFIKIAGEKSKGNVIEGCTFRDHTFPGEIVDGKLKKNGGEPIRIGNSDLSGVEFKTTVRHCVFRNLKGDPETVSIKSCGNVLENNLHEDCESNFTIRHGGLNIIRNNVFKGSGGIRVLGDGNEITGNIHQNNANKAFPPLSIWKGNVQTDRNFVSDGKPSGKMGDRTHAEYARSKNNLIEGNIYDNCEGTCVVWGRFNKKNGRPAQKLRPIKNNIRNNMIIADNIVSTLLLKFDDDANMADNVFEANKLFGEKAKRGDMRQEAIEILSTRPVIEIPDTEP